MPATMRHAHIDDYGAAAECAGHFRCCALTLEKGPVALELISRSALVCYFRAVPSRRALPEERKYGATTIR